MSEDERLERLTEMARRVWPDTSHPLVVHHFPNSACVMMGSTIFLDVFHTRALDALEAALLVMAGDPPAWAEALAAKWEAAARDAGGSELVMSLAAELRERAKGGER